LGITQLAGGLVFGGIDGCAQDAPFLAFCDDFSPRPLHQPGVPDGGEELFSVRRVELVRPAVGLHEGHLEHPFDTVEELLLVRGVTPEIFYGIKVKDEAGRILERYGLVNYVTVYTFSIQINLKGTNLANLAAASEEVKLALQNINGLVDVNSDNRPPKPEIQIQPDRERASRLGVGTFQVASLMRTFIDGDTTSKYREADKLIDIRVRA
jgi:hypothetical protein